MKNTQFKIIVSYTLLFFIFNLLKKAKTGHIYPGELDIAFLNVEYVNMFTLTFALENGLGPLDYIMVKFPFNIGES